MAVPVAQQARILSQVHPHSAHHFLRCPRRQKAVTRVTKADSDLSRQGSPQCATESVMRVMDIIIGCFRTDKCPPPQSWRAGRAADILQPVACPGLLESRPLGNEKRCAWGGGKGGDWGLCLHHYRLAVSGGRSETACSGILRCIPKSEFVTG